MEVRKNVNGACRLCLHGEGIILVLEENPKCCISPESIYDCVSVKVSRLINNTFPTISIILY